MSIVTVSIVTQSDLVRGRVIRQFYVFAKDQCTVAQLLAYMCSTVAVDGTGRNCS